MEIQSLSIVVPNKKCINNCPFCVSQMHCNEYDNLMNDGLPNFDLSLRDYIKRLEFARDNGCNTLMLTGSSEPQQNRAFLTYFGMFMMLMQRPFRWIEMQTTGVLLDENYLRFLRGHVGVNLISLSVSSFNNYANNTIIQAPTSTSVNLPWLCSKIKRMGFTLRLSLNLTDEFCKYLSNPEQLFAACCELGADQVTLRVLYSSNSGKPQDLWIHENAIHPVDAAVFSDYVKSHGTVLGVLPHGAVRYACQGLSVVVDSDCMDKAEKTEENYKYLILRPNCKLYSQWDDPASLIF